MNSTLKLDVPHYKQSTEYTCGPACAMMTLKFFDKIAEMNRRTEFELWRECNMIGSLGADAFGLALTLLYRGLAVKIVTERKETIPMERIARKRGEEMSKIARYAIQLSYDKAKILGAEIVFRRPRISDIKETLDQGTVPIVLVNMYQMHRYNIPHWIVIIGYHGRYVYLNDPFRRKGSYAIKEVVLIRSMDSLATKIGASRSLVKAWRT